MVRSLPQTIDELERLFAEHLYVTNRTLTISAFLALKLGRPLFLEGEAGVGKTEVAKTLAAVLDTELIRLQCYEGIDVAQALYEWNYPRQLLEIRLLETGAMPHRPAAIKELFSEAFLIKRPLLRALEQPDGRVPVLLIDEIDRADDEFEGFLLELLSDFQVTIPEIGTIRAAAPPVVVLTSNRTREIHDALKRRCLYHWIAYPDFDKEYRIITTRMPGAPERLSREVTAFVQYLRAVDLHKMAGVSETLDWVAALVALDQDRLDQQLVDQTLGILLKDHDDIEAMRGPRVAELVGRAHEAAITPSAADR